MRFLVVVCVAAAVTLLVWRDPRPQPATDQPRPVAWQTTNLPVELTAATVATHAARQPAIQLTEPPVAPTTTSPYAPAGLDDCDEMTWYRVQAELPARFDSLGWRESNCTNTPISRTGCCVGYWQIHHVNFRDYRTIDRLAACDATWLNIRGDTPEAKRRQACAAKVLYDVVGYQPWSL